MEQDNTNNQEENRNGTAAVRRVVVRRSEAQPREPMRVVAPRTNFVRKPAPDTSKEVTDEEREAGADVSKDNIRTSSFTFVDTTKTQDCKYSRIILVGMPCSGKTTIGRNVATFCSYTFYDMDEYIEQKAGKTIPEIFAEENGEAKFRELETEAAKELGEMDKVIIATGGGAVTREETMKALKKEGSFTIFIHREFYKIVTTPQRVMDKRPLFENTSFDALLATYKFRLPLYKKYSDAIIDKDKNREEAVAKIKELIFKNDQ